MVITKYQYTDRVHNNNHEPNPDFFYKRTKNNNKSNLFPCCANRIRVTKYVPIVWEGDPVFQAQKLQTRLVNLQLGNTSTSELFSNEI